MKFLIHVHIYYKELWEELAACVRNCMPDADLYVTTTHNDDVLRKKIISAFPNVHYNVVANRGYDIAPFLEILTSVNLSQYEYVIKLHTKRNVWTWLNLTPMPAGRWRRCLLRFCATRRNVAKCLRLFDKDKKIGMICGHHALITEQDESGESSGVTARAEEIVNKVGLSCGAKRFVAGSMFMVRSICLTKIIKNVDLSLFRASETNVHEGTLAHIYERAIGYAILSQGFEITDINKRYAIFFKTISERRAFLHAFRSIYRITFKPFVRFLGFYEKIK